MRYLSSDIPQPSEVFFLKDFLQWNPGLEDEKVLKVDNDNEQQKTSDSNVEQ